MPPKTILRLINRGVPVRQCGNLCFAGARCIGEKRFDRFRSFVPTFLLKLVNPIRDCLNHIPRSFASRYSFLSRFLLPFQVALLNYSDDFLLRHFF